MKFVKFSIVFFVSFLLTACATSPTTIANTGSAQGVPRGFGAMPNAQFETDLISRGYDVVGDAIVFWEPTSDGKTIPVTYKVIGFEIDTPPHWIRWFTLQDPRGGGTIRYGIDLKRPAGCVNFLCRTGKLIPKRR
jgi:hypothetical protein